MSVETQRAADVAADSETARWSVPEMVMRLPEHVLTEMQEVPRANQTHAGPVYKPRSCGRRVSGPIRAVQDSVRSTRGEAGVEARVWLTRHRVMFVIPCTDISYSRLRLMAEAVAQVAWGAKSLRI